MIQNYWDNQLSSLLHSFHQGRQFIVSNEFGGEKLLAHKKNDYLRSFYRVFDFAPPLGTYFYAGIVPKVYILIDF